MPETEKITGRCACGAVSFRAEGPFRDGVACHCETCRRQSGHYIVATSTDPGKVEISNPGGLIWYHATPQARRGFCATCGSNLVWEPASRSLLWFTMGVLDDPRDIRMGEHIFVGEKGSYYQIGDGLPQRDKE